MTKFKLVLACLVLVLFGTRASAQVGQMGTSGSVLTLNKVSYVNPCHLIVVTEGDVTCACGWNVKTNPKTGEADILIEITWVPCGASSEFSTGPGAMGGSWQGGCALVPPSTLTIITMTVTLEKNGQQDDTIVLTYGYTTPAAPGCQ